MPTYADLNMASTKSWDEFEDIVCSAAKNRWRNDDCMRPGRYVQRRDEVDVFGTDDEGRLVGLQCKHTLSGLSKEAVLAEEENAESIRPALVHLRGDDGVRRYWHNAPGEDVSGPPDMGQRHGWWEVSMTEIAEVVRSAGAID
jgi:hypothetical protein